MNKRENGKGGTQSKHANHNSIADVKNTQTLEVLPKLKVC